MKCCLAHTFNQQFYSQLITKWLTFERRFHEKNSSKNFKAFQKRYLGTIFRLVSKDWRISAMYKKELLAHKNQKAVTLCVLSKLPWWLWYAIIVPVHACSHKFPCGCSKKMTSNIHKLIYHGNGSSKLLLLMHTYIILRTSFQSTLFYCFQYECSLHCTSEAKPIRWINDVMEDKKMQLAQLQNLW